MTAVSDLIVAAFNVARNENPGIQDRWIWMSHRIGSQLPRSLLPISMQRVGDVDVVCRSIEKDCLKNPSQEGVLRPTYHSMFSDWWIASAYAVCFTLKERAILADDDFLRLADDLRMICVQSEKYELPSDRKLDEPMHFVPAVPRPDETEPPIYTYDKNDRLRAHIARQGRSARGSLMWEVFDPTTKSTRWLERLELSERMLDLLSPGTGKINA